MKLSRQAVLAYALAVVTIIAGTLAGLATDNWAWLSRSGSVIVIIGILLTSTQILENNRRLRHRRALWETQLRREIGLAGGLNGPSTRDWAHESNLRGLARSRNQQEDTWENERYGLYMLVAGTLVWGFGDVLGPLMFG